MLTNAERVLPPNVATLLGQVRRLERLLEDPHPGLLTWRAAYWDAVSAVAAWANDEVSE